MSAYESSSNEKTFNAISKQLLAAKVFYQSKRKYINIAARNTGHWLKSNNEFYSSDNIPDSGKWWKDLYPTENSILLDLREYVFRCHLFDNGLRRMIWELKEVDSLLFRGKLRREINFAVSHSAMGIHHELMGYIESGRNFTLGLSDLTRRFDLANHVHLRNRRLVPMAELGIWECHSTLSGYAIALGVPAIEFHRHAFQPLKAAFRPEQGRFEPAAVRFPG